MLQLYKVHIGSDIYFLYTAYDDGEMDVSLTNCNVSYKGKICGKDIQKMSADVGMEKEDFIKLMLEAFGGNSSNSFVYDLIPVGDHYKFGWKQVMSDEMKFQLGAMEIYKESQQSNCMVNIIENAIEQVEKLKEECFHVKQSNERLEKENKYVSQKFEKYVKDKETLDGEFYSKFADVLNAKKAKIKELQARNPDNDKVTALKPSPPKMAEAKNTTAAKVKTTMKHREIFLESSDDDDVHDIPLKKSRKKVHADQLHQSFQKTTQSPISSNDTPPVAMDPDDLLEQLLDD